MDKKGEIYDLHEEIFNNGPLLKLTHEECEQLAAFLVEIDYRKASDVAREIFEELKKEIEEDLNIELHLTKNLKKVLALIKELQGQVENLKKENKYLRDRLSDEMEHKEDMEGKDGH